MDEMKDAHAEIVEPVLKESEEKYRLMHEELMAVHEELTASEEELLQQFADLASIALNNAVLVESLKKEIQERKRMEEALLISEQKFSRIFYLSPDCVGVSRLKDGRYNDINQGFTCLLGYAKEEVLGKTSEELMIWADYNDRESFVEELKQHGEVIEMETRFRSKDGSIKDCLLSARLINFGGEEHLLFIVHDITERKKTEDKLIHLGLQDSLTKLYNTIELFSKNR